MKFKSFEAQILHFNGMYKLPVAAYPTVFYVLEDEKKRKDHFGEVADKQLVMGRISDFRKTLSDELDEATDIIRWLTLGKAPVDKKDPSKGFVDYGELEFLTDMADWLGDIQVYCASEMAKYGIPIRETLDIIMASNFSKLDAEGKPIYDDRGKVLKGPGYWKPEPQIKEMLKTLLLEAIAKTKENGIVW